MTTTNIYNDSTKIAQDDSFVVISKFKKKTKTRSGYQTEAELENQLVHCLINEKAYSKLEDTSPAGLERNLRKQLARLNKDQVGDDFTEAEWQELKNKYLDVPNDTHIDKTRKFQNQHICEINVADGRGIKNIKIIDKEYFHNNVFQVAQQIQQTGSANNRYDVTIFVNGLPLVQVELKRRGVNLKEAFNQIHRYSKESFNAENSLFKFIQIFVISNGTLTRYFANTTATNKNNYKFTNEWTDANNNIIQDLEEFAETFFSRRTLHAILTKYCVFDTTNTLLIMRPYQIAASERILSKIYTSICNHDNLDRNYRQRGGYIWHTTGSGKTLTSFKTSKLATEIAGVDKVLFIVDRKDLDYQTVKEYSRFDKRSVNGTNKVEELKKVIEQSDNKIVVTTIQKLDRFIKKNNNHPIYKKRCVMIFDECHRSQFGHSQNLIKQKFKNSYLFGFTGTPILSENSIDNRTTEDVFGECLHKYIITDAIRDNKVLPFKVDYYNAEPSFKEAEVKAVIETSEYYKKVSKPQLSTSVNAEKLTSNSTTDDEVEAAIESRIETITATGSNDSSNSHSPDQDLTPEECRKLLLHPDRIKAVTNHILQVFDQKTSRNTIYNLKERRLNGFNAIFAVQNIDAAKLYYEEFKKQQASLDPDKRLKVATIFSYLANEEPAAIGEIVDESYDFEKKLTSKALTSQELTSKEFLMSVMDEYNSYFNSNFNCSCADEFEQYYRDLSFRVKEKQIDLLIVVGMFLTGFDAPTLNTLFVDRNLQYHGLIQAFSRTNRILNDVKQFGNIVCFRDLSEATKNAIRLFGVKDKHDVNLIIQPSFDELYNGYIDESGKKHLGYKQVLAQISEYNRILEDNPDLILYSESKTITFCKDFGKYLNLENKIKFYDEYNTDQCKKLDDRVKQNLKSYYLNFRDTYNATRNRSHANTSVQTPTLDFSEVSFEIDLLKTEDINNDYILTLINEKTKEALAKEKLEQANHLGSLSSDASFSLDEQGLASINEKAAKDFVIQEVDKVVKSSVGLRKKSALYQNFIESNFDNFKGFNEDPDSKYKITELFHYHYVPKARKAAVETIIDQFKLKNNEQQADQFINGSIDKGYVERTGTRVIEILPSSSRFGRNNLYTTTKADVLDAIQNNVDVFSDI